MSQPNCLWTIDELVASVALALSLDNPGHVNGRVRAIPDERTIRYYTTLGILRPPAAFRGRTALYGRSHLVQLAAIKRLQARGLSLSQIQVELMRLGDREVEALAGVPDTTDFQTGELGENWSGPASGHAPAFWRAAPVLEEEQSRSASPRVCSEEQEERSGSSVAPGSPPVNRLAGPLQGLPLDDAVTLLLATDRPLYRQDIEAIRNAAAPLLKLLHLRRLVRPRQEGRIS
jgi:DNA-binding transcriptional MerR regulator